MAQPDAGRPHPQRVLGIDPGFGATGWGVIDDTPDGLRYVASGTIKTPSTLSRQERLAMLSRRIGDVIRSTLPAVAGIEDVMVGRNRSVVVGTAAAIGVIEETCARYAIPCVAYPPGQVKYVIGGSGRCEKPVLRAAVEKRLGCELKATALHASDAVAVAIMRAENEKTRM